MAAAAPAAAGDRALRERDRGQGGALGTPWARPREGFEGEKSGEFMVQHGECSIKNG